LIPDATILEPQRMPATILASTDVTSSATRVSDRAFEQLRKLIQQEAGICLSKTKRTLLASRLGGRLRALRLATYDDYYHYLLAEDRDGRELQEVINCISTTKTDFFREAHHFDFLRDVAFSQWRLAAAQTKERTLRVWSAACSKGHEPYSIALTFLQHFSLIRAWDIRVLATDINTKVLETARQGIYPLDEIAGLDKAIRDRWFLTGTGRFDGLCRVGTDARRLVTFAPLNLAERTWPMRGKFDAIFCRNVLIYFDEALQWQVIEHLVDQLAPSGYLFLGHSENQSAQTSRLRRVGQTIYQKRDS